MATIELTPDHGYVLMVAGVVALQARARARCICAAFAFVRKR
jgi:hypothetical protein